MPVIKRKPETFAEKLAKKKAGLVSPDKDDH